MIECQKPFTQNRKRWYRVLKFLMRSRYKKPEFIFLGDKPSHGAIILSNHVGTDAPMSLEIYCDFPIRMWGTHEMNSGLIKLYKYQSKVYYHEKKHWNLHLARLFCIIASPLTSLFYKGLNLISTYKDFRFKYTLEESLKTIKNKKENIVIFPEKSDEGYLDELKGFHGGFVVLAEYLLRNQIDVPIYVSYFNLKEMTYIFGNPINYSTLKKMGLNRNEIAEYLVNECNKLNKLNLKNVEEESLVKV
ncbi:hypothetical protein [Acholeplasma hippikon]|uniref:Phospholipid/glycerol acyltransferase domain-containing protein n=1 Tax=Acholeplasma hippikon TaxID=264636 RepID=A0A449BJ12_9MOLU|nr:hypothetical protein [Acholeplasma hippikon]VEU82449.1 Uncharacterised protein [Acholeplasma hippikon]